MTAPETRPSLFRSAFQILLGTLIMAFVVSSIHLAATQSECPRHAVVDADSVSLAWKQVTEQLQDLGCVIVRPSVTMFTTPAR